MLLARLKNLKNLILTNNDIRTLPNFEETDFPKLKNLDLEGNNITRPEDFASLSRLPRLLALNLSENHITAFSFKPKEESAPFPVLNELYLNDNQIPDLNSLQGIQNAPFLKKLIIYNNPLVREDGELNINHGIES